MEKEMQINMAWVPLESNPEVMTKFLHGLGVPKSWSIVDVYGLEPELLEVLPKPVAAVILLYPLKKPDEDVEELKDKAKEGLENPEEEEASPQKGVYHMRQYISNACGTIALIHSVANNLDVLNLGDGFLKTFLEDTSDLSMRKRGMHLLNSKEISVLHEESALEGQTQAPDLNMPVNNHFVALVHRDGVLYELDGRKPGPIEHGPTSPEKFLEDAARVCKEYMARDPEEVGFTVVALAQTD